MNEKQINNKRFVLPNIPEITNNLKKILYRKYNISTIFRVPIKLSKYIRRVKEPVKTMDQKNVWYKIYCKCGKYYLGQTKRNLCTKISEHSNNGYLNDKYHNVI